MAMAKTGEHQAQTFAPCIGSHGHGAGEDVVRSNATGLARIDGESQAIKINRRARRGGFRDKAIEQAFGIDAMGEANL